MSGFTSEASATDDEIVQQHRRPAPGFIQDIPLSEPEVQELLANYNSLRVLLVGLSHAGKSSLFNALFQDHELARIGTVHATTDDLLVRTLELSNVGIYVFDTPGFIIGNKSRNTETTKIIKQCKCVDIIFLCFSLNSSSHELEELVKLVTKSFDKQVWKKVMVVFTKANTVMPTGLHCNTYNKESYNDKVFADLKESMINSLTLKKLKIELNSGQFTRAGDPGSKPVELSQQQLEDPCKYRFDHPEIWIRNMLLECFRSSCWSIDAKAALLRVKWGKLQISTAALSIGTGCLLVTGGIACAAIGVTASFAGPVTWSFSLPLVIAGGALCSAGLASGLLPTSAIIGHTHTKGKRQKKEVEKVHQESKVSAAPPAV